VQDPYYNNCRQTQTHTAQWTGIAV